jgi:hypothetical protein
MFFFLLSLERKETNRAQQDLDNKSELELALVAEGTACNWRDSAWIWSDINTQQVLATASCKLRSALQLATFVAKTCKFRSVTSVSAVINKTE